MYIFLFSLSEQNLWPVLDKWGVGRVTTQIVNFRFQDLNLDLETRIQNILLTDYRANTNLCGSKIPLRNHDLSGSHDGNVMNEMLS